MIVAFLNQKGGVGKTTLALHLAGAWSARGRRVLVVDADPQASALDWADQRLREGLPRLFGVLGLARETLHKEPPDLASATDPLIIDRPPRLPGLARPAPLPPNPLPTP